MSKNEPGAADKAMAQVRTPRELIHYCCETNAEYMRLPAGQLHNYRQITALYQRLADQALLCAGAWLRSKPCPDHEPAVSAFWWAAVAWAEAFGTSIGVDPVEWQEVFVLPHLDFASYLRPGERCEVIEPHAGQPAEVIMELDARWMRLVMKLTGKWGMWEHLKDLPALREAERLERELRAPDGQTRDAYLRSDLKFFRELFEPFPFKYQTRQQIKDWLAMADPDDKEWREAHDDLSG